MAITYISNPGLVSADIAAAGSASVTSPDNYRRHQFFVTISAAATVSAEASIDGVSYVPVATAITSSDSIFLVGVFPHLRISWTGNTGTVTVDHVAADDTPAEWS